MNYSTPIGIDIEIHGLLNAIAQHPAIVLHLNRHDTAVLFVAYEKGLLPDLPLSSWTIAGLSIVKGSVSYDSECSDVIASALFDYYSRLSFSRLVAVDAHGQFSDYYTPNRTNRVSATIRQAAYRQLQELPTGRDASEVEAAALLTYRLPDLLTVVSARPSEIRTMSELDQRILCMASKRGLLYGLPTRLMILNILEQECPAPAQCKPFNASQAEYYRLEREAVSAYRNDHMDEVRKMRQRYED
jgi:hypothetical protein